MSSDPAVVILAGGTGGAKLARGMLDVVGDRLVVVLNTGDDIEIYDAHVSPDPDLVSYWLADRIDDRGWGIDGDTFEHMDALRTAGEDVWFNLGDQDLDICRRRLERMREGARLTDTLAQLGEELGLRARVLPATDDPVHTYVRAGGREVPFQEFMIRSRAEGPVEGVRFAGIAEARPTPEVLGVLATASAIVIGPSNPSVSIGPMLELPGMREALAAAPAPVVAVSPIVGGQVLKGPTAAFMEGAGLPVSAEGAARAYEGVIDAMVADEPVEGLPTLRTDTDMADAAARRRLAAEVLDFSAGLGPR